MATGRNGHITAAGQPRQKKQISKVRMYGLSKVNNNQFTRTLTFESLIVFPSEQTEGVFAPLHVTFCPRWTMTANLCAACFLATVFFL